MPAIQRQIYKSPSQNHVSGSTLRFSGFVPMYGPNGLRNVIDLLEVVYDFTDITFVTAGNEGEDVWRAIDRIVVEQADGVQRFNLTGDELRVFCYVAMGADRVPEYGDQAAGANQALTYSFPVPFEKRYAKRPKEFSLPADVLKEVKITCCGTGATSLGLGGGTVTITAATVSINAICHEESAVAMKVADSVLSTPFPSTAGLTLPVGGRLHDLILTARAASGGAAMTNFTDIRIDGLLPEPLKRSPDLLQPYLRSRGAANNDPGTDGGGVHNDPIAQGRAVAVLFTDDDTSAFDGSITDQVILRCTNSVANVNAISRVVLPENPQLKASLERRHGIAPNEWRAKTVSKQKRNIGDHPVANSAFLEQTAPLRRRGLAR